jgi:site-specific DNA recombinase
VPDPNTSMNILEMFEMWINGIDYKIIAEKFKVSSSSMYTIIKNPVYIGKIRYKGQIYEGKHKPLISEEVWNKANNVTIPINQTKDTEIIVTNPVKSEDKN